MKKNNTLFWVLAVIALYVLVVFPNMLQNAYNTNRGSEQKNTEEVKRPTVEELENARNGGGYTL